MKSIKALILAAAAAGIAASTAHADVTVRVCGSTAYRGNVVSAVYHKMTSVSTTQSVLIAYSGAGPVTKASQAILQGAFPGVAGTTTVYFSWSGSASGILAVGANPQTNPNTHVASTSIKESYLPTTTVLSSGTLSSGGNANQTANDLEVADIGFSDIYQSSSPFTAGSVLNAQGPPFSNGLAAGDNYKMASLNDLIVGVVPFSFIANSGAPLTNITTNNGSSLWQNGQLPLSYFTGATSDSGSVVNAGGRDRDSGTRGNAFFDLPLAWSTPAGGSQPKSAVNQAFPTIAAGVINGYTQYPATTLFGVLPTVAGDGGESSGGTLAGYFNATVTDPVNVGYFVGYLGTSDTLTALNATHAADLLAFQGVKLTPTSGVYPNLAYQSSDYDVVRSGYYQYWGNEHLFHQSLTGDKLTFANGLQSQISGTDAQITIPSMQVGSPQGNRNTDGAPY